MKISKLFHWLYAILMFLPILVFIPNAFYYGFNKEAVAQEKTEQVPVYYDSNEINNVTDLTIGNVYHWNNNYISSLDYLGIRYFGIESQDFTNKQLGITQTYTNGYIITYSQDGSLLLQLFNGNTWLGNISIPHQQFDFILSYYNEQYFNQYGSHIEYTNNKYIKEYQPLTTNMSITDSMSYAWESVWQNDLFSWTNNTFLKQPFVYITDLFSIPSDNVLINALSYWLDISIIWLVFDVIMYVPLLTHRWLDKGIVE